MKPTLVSMTLMLLAGQALAGTEIQGATQNGIFYEGSATGTGANVLISDGGNDMSTNSVYGCRNSTTTSVASGNVVTMTGGQVNNVYGAYWAYGAENNTVIVTGGTIKYTLCAGYANKKASYTRDNSVYLLGEGATATIEGTQYTGQAGISIGTVSPGFHSYQAQSTGNALNIYGTGISIGTIDSYAVQEINFYMTSAIHSGGTMVNMGESLTLGNVEVNINALAADWIDDFTDETGACDITLLSQLEGIGNTVFSFAGMEAGGDFTLTGTNADYSGRFIGFLANPEQLENRQMAVVLQGGALKLMGKGISKTAHSTPEPATGTLSLLALAGLCMRRRR